MQAIQFEESIANILKRDARFDAHAYFFLKEALDFTLKRIAETNAGQARHVSGAELLLGFRDHALEQFGPMAATLMAEWGVHRGEDVGDMVFHLIEEQVFGKQESDSHKDFADVMNLMGSLQAPFLPESKLAATKGGC
ncbi:MAG: Minf_1886 family protein [Luteolibacter sp.]